MPDLAIVLDAAFKSALVGVKLMYDTSANWQRLPARACDVDDF
jgi:hypothetical protein